MSVNINLCNANTVDKCNRVAVLITFDKGTDARIIVTKLRKIIDSEGLPTVESANVYRYEGSCGGPVLTVS